MGGKTAQSTQQVSVPPQVLAQYQSVNQEAQAAGSAPFQQYGGQFVAPVNSTQQAGISATNQYSQEAQPYFSAAASGLSGTQAATNPVNNAALGLAGASAEQVNAQQIGPQQISQFENPYLNSVLGSTSALINQNNQQQQSGALGTAVQSGAFGGDRTGIAAANLEQQQNLSNANIYSGIASNAFNTALGAAQQQQGVNLSAGQANRTALANAGQEIAGIGSTAYGEGANTASELGSLGSGAQSSALSGAQAQIGAGTLEQQTQQASDTALYNQFLQQESYPFQVAGFEAGVAEGTGALSGSTTTTQQPGGFFSDRRLKHDIKKIGKTYDGQTIYSYKMHNDARTHIGLMAQDVEKKHPRSVGLAGGYKFVDYGQATEAAANRGHFYSGGVVPIRAGLSIGGSPYSPQVNDGTSTTTSPVSAGHSALVSGLASGASPTPGTSGMGGLVGLANGTGVEKARGGRAHFDGGGYAGPYGDMSSILATQENMYQPNQSRNRNIPNAQAQNHQLAVASGSPTPGPSGASNTNTTIGLGEKAYGLGSKGYNAYQNNQIANVSNYSPSVDANTFEPGGMGGMTPTPTSAPPIGGLSGATSPDVAAAGADAAPTAGLAAPAAAEAAPVAADAAGTAAAGAGTAAAGAAGSAAAGAAVDAGATEAAALAAEYVAADAAVAAIAAKRGGKIKRPGLDAGGVPYEGGIAAGAPYSNDSGVMDIPDEQNTAKLQTAGALKKQPTGLQTLMTLGSEQGATSAIGGMFSNQGLGSKRGGRIHKDDGGDVTLPDIEVDGQRPTDDLTPVQVDPHERLGLAAANDDVPTPAEQPKKSALGAVGDFWDRNKTNIIPALEGLAAMGTAPTKHLGVALAAGLGAGAQSYFPTQQAAANVQQTQLQNERTGYQLNALKSPPPSGGSSGAPSQPGFSGVGADPSNIAAEAQRRFAFKDIWTPQEQANLQRQQQLQQAGLPNTLPTIMALHTSRMQNQQTAQQQGALGAYNAAYQAATAAPGAALAKVMNIDPLAAKQIQERSNGDADTADSMARTWASEVGNQTYQQTGRKPVTGKDGVSRDPFSQRPILGQVPEGLSAEENAANWARLAGRVDTGANARPALGATPAGSQIPTNPQPTVQIPGSPGASPAPPSAAGPSGAPAAPKGPRAQPGAPSVPKGSNLDFSDAPDKPAYIGNPNVVLSDDQKDISKKYADTEAELKKEAGSLQQTQAQVIQAKRMLAELPNAKTGPGTQTMSAIQTALGNMTGSQFTSWLGSNPAAYALLQKGLGNTALQQRLSEMKGEGAEVKLGVGQDNLIINKLSASTEMPKPAIAALLNQQIQQATWEMGKQAAIPAYLAQGKDAMLFDNYYSTKHPLSGALSTAAPAGTTVPTRPGQQTSGVETRTYQGKTYTYNPANGPRTDPKSWKPQ